MSKSLPHIIDLHPGIMLKGQLSMARDVVLTGKFEGEIQTVGCLTVASGGAVKGMIEAGALVLEPGNEVDAEVKIARTALPTPAWSSKPVEVKSGWAQRLKKIKDMALGRRG